VEQNALIAAAAIVAMILVLSFWFTMRKRRTSHLRDRFGNEYDHAVEASGNRSRAEADLAAREKRVAALEIRPMTATESGSFSQEWHEVKAIFVDSPTEAVLHADRMLAAMMKTIGYPMADFNRRYEDLTVNHADIAHHYREGRGIVERHNGGAASTEDMRQAMKHYEAVFDRLIADAASGKDRPADGPGATEERLHGTDFRNERAARTARD
jgi:hypothetical protein